MNRIMIEDLEVSIMWSGEPTFDECLASIDNQIYVPAHVDVIRDVSPISKAINERHRKMDRRFSVKVDADFILARNCFKVLYETMKGKAPEYYAVSGLVNDIFMGPIGGIHLERTACVKDLIVPDIIGCDRWISEKMKEKGYKFFEIQEVLAEHRVDWSWENVFARYFRLGQKHAYFSTHRHDDYIRNIGKYWIKKKNRLAFLALVGYCHGLFVFDAEEKGNDFARKELDVIKRLINSGVIPL